MRQKNIPMYIDYDYTAYIDYIDLNIHGPRKAIKLNHSFTHPISINYCDNIHQLIVIELSKHISRVRGIRFKLGFCNIPCCRCKLIMNSFVSLILLQLIKFVNHTLH